MNRRRRHRGFTFLEVILAMAMVSMVALSLYASLRIGFRAKDSATRAVGPVRAASVAMEMLRDDIESAMSPTGILAGQFIGDHDTNTGQTTDSLEFFCVGQGPNHPDPTGWGGVRKVDLLVTTLSDGTPNVLVRQITGNLLSPTAIDPDQEVICRGVRSFRLRYWDGDAWQDTWDSTQLNNSLPIAVEATLELDWPPTRKPALDAPPAYRAVRIFRLACYRDMTAEAAATPAAGTGAGTGAKTGAGGNTSSGSGNRPSGGSTGGSSSGTGGAARGGGR